MKAYTYDIYQLHQCFTKDTYDVKANSQAEADKLMLEYYKSGDESEQIIFVERECDFDTLEAIGDYAEIYNENNENING